MVTAVVGRTDKRPVIYTLIKLYQTLGDCCLISHNPLYTRLINDGGLNIGHFQNTLIAVTDASSDEVFAEMGYRAIDFEHIIFDCIDNIPDYADVVIWVGGSDGMTEDDETLLSMYPGYHVINLGFGEKSIPYTVDMFKACEVIEGLKHLVLPSSQLASRLAAQLSDKLGMPATTIVKVVQRK